MPRGFRELLHRMRLSAAHMDTLVSEPCSLLAVQALTVRLCHPWVHVYAHQHPLIVKPYWLCLLRYASPNHFWLSLSSLKCSYHSVIHSQDLTVAGNRTLQQPLKQAEYHHLPLTSELQAEHLAIAGPMTFSIAKIAQLKAASTGSIKTQSLTISPVQKVPESSTLLGREKQHTWGALLAHRIQLSSLTTAVLLMTSKIVQVSSGPESLGPALLSLCSYVQPSFRPWPGILDAAVWLPSVWMEVGGNCVPFPPLPFRTCQTEAYFVRRLERQLP